MRGDGSSLRLLKLILWGLCLHLSCLTPLAIKDTQATHLLESPVSFHTKRSHDQRLAATGGEVPLGSEHEVEAQFDNTTATNVTAQLGTTAFLQCRVRNLGDRTVSWIRHRKDFNIITVGRYTYSSDQRFQMIHIDEADDWTLQIKFTQKRDAGLYECQVSSDPPISLFVTLNVVVAKAEIIEVPDKYYVKSGSDITLKCRISQSPEPPVYVFWFNDHRMINYDTTRGGITVNTERGDSTISELTIKNVVPSDTGNYTCGPSNADNTSVALHVLNGEIPAAMQHDGTACADHVTSQMPAILMGLLVSFSTMYFSLR